ncbi:major capsid protein [Peromfec virus RodF7_14]|uniref:Major capsid protein n=1 Tax=Peromfec virus RodF7_14 TaxID=2929349 RepID=A0A976N223_9VIRU|nr:major capsid protein [Peromfec virus RodF7_14]
MSRKGKRRSRNIFNSVPLSIPKKNAFNLSHDVKLTCEMGELVPFLCEPVLPNDTFKVSSEHLIKFAPLVAPIMSNVDVYVHYFFVPTRLLWDDWETFITGSDDGEKLPDDELPAYPLNKVNGTIIDYYFEQYNNSRQRLFGIGTLADYLGFQTLNTAPRDSYVTPYPLDDMPFRVYHKIFDDYYRDENLQDKTFTPEWRKQGYNSAWTNQSPSVISDRYVRLHKRAWKKDYFTSALPFAQKGDDVLLPLQGSADISPTSQTYIGSLTRNTPSLGDFVTGSPISGSSDQPVRAYGSGGASGTKAALHLTNVDGTTTSMSFDPSNFHTIFNMQGIADRLSVDLSTASATTIRELRRAYAAQRFLERRAIGGTRYIEQNLSMFGARSSDGRLQRAEFLGGSKQPLVVSQVLQTSQTTTGDDASPLGQPAGNAQSIGGNFAFSRTFSEYGYIMGIMSVMPKADYMSGIPRKYLRSDPYDYYWPQFARIGEQPIYNQELYFDITSSQSNNEGTFGYTPRYAEYRFNNNRVCGDFKDTLSAWTLARSFDKIPALNSSFIQCNPSSRIWAYENDDFSHLWVQIALNIKALRPIPKYGEAL